MAVTATLADHFREKLLSHVDPIDFDTDDIYVALMGVGFTFDRAADEFWSDVVADEASGVGYTAYGQQLTTIAIGVDGTGHFAYVDADDVTWTSSTIDAVGAMVYKKAATDATSPLVGYVDFGATESTTAADFKLTWAAPASGGVVKL